METKHIFRLGKEVKKMIVEMIDEMLAVLVEAKKEAEKFDRGNKSAGTRVRAAMQEIKTKAQSVRFKITGR